MIGKWLKQLLYAFIIVQGGMWFSFLVSLGIYNLLLVLTINNGVLFFLLGTLIPQVLAYLICGTVAANIIGENKYLYLLCGIVLNIIGMANGYHFFKEALIASTVGKIFIQSASGSIVYFSWISLIGYYFATKKRRKDTPPRKL